MRAAPGCAPTCWSASQPPSCAPASLRGRTTTWGAASCLLRWVGWGGAGLRRGGAHLGLPASFGHHLCSLTSPLGPRPALLFTLLCCCLPALPACRSGTSTSCSCRPTRGSASALASAGPPAAPRRAPRASRRCGSPMALRGSPLMRLRWVPGQRQWLAQGPSGAGLASKVLCTCPVAAGQQAAFLLLCYSSLHPHTTPCSCRWRRRAPWSNLTPGSRPPPAAACRSQTPWPWQPRMAAPRCATCCSRDMTSAALFGIRIMIAQRWVGTAPVPLWAWQPPKATAHLQAYMPVAQ